MPERIAILTSTRPLRIVERRGGRERQVIDPKACMELALRFSLVIIASRASDRVFERIAQSITSNLRRKFRFYSRTYFNEFTGGDEVTDPPMNKAWLEILKHNHIIFDMQAKIIGEDFSVSYQEFDWKNLKPFITDERVVFIETHEQIFGSLQ